MTPPPGPTPKLPERKTMITWKNIEISKTAIEKHLKTLKPDKSPGIDGPMPRMLRETSEQISDPLEIFFIKSIEIKQIPKEWKLAKVSALYTKGNRSLAGNYRPVSLTSVVCKVLERMVRDHIIKFMSSNDYFTNKQYWFMPGRSTSLQLLRVVDEWTEAIDSGDSIDCVYMDYQTQCHTKDY